jgi:aspartokinase
VHGEVRVGQVAGGETGEGTETRVQHRHRVQRYQRKIEVEQRAPTIVVVGDGATEGCGVAQRQILQARQCELHFHGKSALR